MAATLTSAAVTFHTNDENKDHDTHVTVTVRDRNGDVAARISDDFGEFKDHSEDGPFQLVIENPSSRTDLSGGNVEVRIDPNGDDTWHFNFFVDMSFSDGSHLNASADNLELDEDRQEQTFGVS